MSEVDFIIIPKSRHEGRYEGRVTQGLNVKSIERDVIFQENLYILNNIDEVQPYLSTHKRLIEKIFPQMNKKWI